MNDDAVHLEQAEQMHAALTGILRHIRAQRATIGTRRYSANFGWSMRIEAAAAELALAKLLGVYWDAICGGRGADCRGNLQVRHSSNPASDLIVREDDDSGDLFVLMTGEAPRFQFRGWLKGDAAKQERFWRDEGNRGAFAWFVPQSELSDLESLRNALKG